MWTSGDLLLPTPINNKMLLSYYEVYITSLRACTAMGFPHGLNEDAAYITTWLELHKFDGIKKLSEFSKNYKKQIKKKISLNKLRSNKSININNSSLLLNGPGLIDILCEKTKNNNNLEIIIKNCKDPIYILPIIKKISKKFYFIKASWSDKKNKNYCINFKKNNVYVGENNKNTILYGDIILQFLLKKDKSIKWKYNLNISKIKKKIDYNSDQEKLEDSLKPQKKYWNNVEKIANKSFVPATKKSREKGAGGGDDND